MDINKFEDDIVFAKFINYMQLALYHTSATYFREVRKIQDYETILDESIIYEDTNIKINTYKTSVLNNKEKLILTHRYERGLSYEQISNITNEKIDTLKKRRNRAIEKLRNEMEE